jgi:hypothetical protein
MERFHDDDCGEALDEHGFCPKCKFHPDMQSVGLRAVQVKIERFISAVENAPMPSTARVRRICYTGEYEAPDPMTNLTEEREAATWKLTHRELPQPAKSALVRYIQDIDKLLRLCSTSAKEKDDG